MPWAWWPWPGLLPSPCPSSTSTTRSVACPCPSLLNRSYSVHLQDPRQCPHTGCCVASLILTYIKKLIKIILRIVYFSNGETTADHMAHKFWIIACEIHSTQQISHSTRVLVSQGGCDTNWWVGTGWFVNTGKKKKENYILKSVKEKRVELIVFKRVVVILISIRFIWEMQRWELPRWWN